MLGDSWYPILDCSSGENCSSVALGRLVCPQLAADQDLPAAGTANRPQPGWQRPTISQKARDAICLGVEREDGVAELELLGFPLCAVNSLEKHLNVILLGELLALSESQFLSVPGHSPRILIRLFRALSRYHQLPALQQQREAALQRRAIACRRKPDNPVTQEDFQAGPDYTSDFLDEEPECPFDTNLPRPYRRFLSND